jgi:predicted ATPase/class 3 adenylate cyclase
MRYLFGDCVFDTERHTLERQAQSIPLQPREFKMLAYLLAQCHRVVSRQELFEQVWAGQYVSKAALEGCITLVRRAIGDSGRAQRLLKTQHGVGYRFVAAVTEEDVVELEPQTTTLAAQTSSSASAALPAGPVRRQITILSCSLAASPHLPSQREPDELHATIRAFHVQCTDIVQQFGGSIAQRSSDGCVAYFGYPTAHDDDARRAVLAGLALLATVHEDGTPLKIGIHTGLVVVEPLDDVGSASPLVVGDATAVAAALRDLAAPHTVLISASTAGLVEGYVTWQAVPPYTPPAQRDPIPVYRVTGESGARLRLDTMPAHRLTPFVGREAEQALLAARWSQACDGRGQAVLLSGEAGIGKSRLVRMLAEHLSETGSTVLEGRGSPYYTQTAFYPIGDMLHQTFRLGDLPRATDPLRQCEAVLQQCGLDAQAHLPFVAPLVNLPLPPERDVTAQLTPQRRRQRTFASLCALFIAMADQQPLLFVLEDLHWMDPTTLEWLDLLLDQTPSSAILLLLTCRPEFNPPWALRSYLTQVTLDRLSVQQSSRMVASIIRHAALPEPVVQQIVEHSDGVPLFIEELTRSVLDTGSTARVPTTLQDALMARLDQVGAARRTAQLGAIIGRQFDDALIRAVSPLDEMSLQQDLHCLVGNELLYQRGVGSDATYRFKHALIQDAAYQSLLKGTRQQFHQQVARAVETHFPEIAEQQPELLAHHYTEAGISEQAISYWQKAGEKAILRSANLEAIIYLRKGMELFATLPDKANRTEGKLALRLVLGEALKSAKGFAAPEVEHEYNRAYALCQCMGNTTRLFEVLRGLRQFYLMRGPLQTACEVGEHYLKLARQHQNTAAVHTGHFLLGNPLFCRGDLITALTHLQQNNGPVSSAWRALLLWHLGYPDQARQTIREALSQKFSNARSQAIALMCASTLHQLRREWDVAQQQAAAVMTLGTEHDLALLLSQGTLLHGRAVAANGNADEGIRQIERGIAAYLATGARAWQPMYLCILAGAYEQVGQAAQGLRQATEALAIVAATEERWWEPELHRLQGALLLQLSPDNHIEAEACFQRALDVARSQQAKSWELRAAISLARLWQQDKRQDAYDLLAPVYNWFSEGFDTADLQDAKALLQEFER